MSALEKGSYCQTVEVNRCFLLDQIKNAPQITYSLVSDIAVGICTEHDIDESVLDLKRTVKNLQSALMHMKKVSKSIRGGHQKERYKKFLSESPYQLNIWCYHESPIKKKMERIQKKCKKLSEALNKSAEHVDSLQIQVRRLSDRMKNLAGKKKKRFRSKKFTSPSKYSRSQKWRYQTSVVDEIKDSLAFLGYHGYEPLSVKVKNKHGIIEELVVENDKPQSDTRNLKKFTDEDLNEVNLLIYVKDKFCVSNEALHELCMVQTNMPRSNRIFSRIKELNSECKLRPTPDPIDGVQQSIQDTISDNIRGLVASAPSDSLVNAEHIVRVKLSGDGTNIGKRMSVENFTYSLIDHEDKSYSGNHYLAIFKGPEKYDILTKALAELAEETMTLSSVEVDGVWYRLQYFLGGDLKFLNVVTGIDSCCCKFSCPFCKCPKDKFHDITQSWSQFDESLGARTVDEIARLSKLKKDNFNCSHSPIFSSIPIRNVIPDTLHLFLRISDQLVGKLISELRERDNIARVPKTFSKEKCTNVTKFEQFVKSLGISDFSFRIDRTTKQFTFRDFQGPEHLKILENIRIDEFIPGHEKIVSVQYLWTEFLRLIKLLKDTEHRWTIEEIAEFRKCSQKWVQTYSDTYLTKDVTVYMHILSQHIHEGLREHGNLSLFNQQALEKLNEKTTSWFFRSSNHRQKEAFEQVMLKKFRLERLKLACKRKLKFNVTCKNCSQPDHNRRTCPRPLLESAMSAT